MGYKRYSEDQKRLRKVYMETKDKYGPGVYFDWRKNRLIRFSFSRDSGMPRYLKRLSNKRVRRMENIPMRGGYKKVFDYWWELY